MYNAAIGALRLGHWKEARELLRRAQMHGLNPATVRYVRGRIWRFKIGGVRRAIGQFLGLAARR
jgi:hypothetical protein